MKQYSWTIIGAGPAGIAAVGKLCDLNIKGENILWIDPDFQGGDLGKLWRNISSNTTVERFLRYCNYYESFKWSELTNNIELSKLPPDETCLLTYPADALLAISDILQQKVTAKHDWVNSIIRDDHHGWMIKSKEGVFKSKNIILTQGSEPSQLNITDSPQIRSFVDAIDPERLKTCFDKSHTYAVFGASHSAIIILENLINLGAKKIINFYRHPCKYAVDMGDWILYDDTGLKGKAALWAKQHIDGQIPENMLRVESTKDNIQRYLPQCDEVIYATGFHRRDSIHIDGADIHQYDAKTGKIAPGLYGYGIAYPEEYMTPIGEIEYRVGLSKFVEYIDTMQP